LASKQNEWSDLLIIDSIAKPVPHNYDFNALGHEDRMKLGAAWVIDGIHARHTDYPSTSREINNFILSRSSVLRTVYNVVVILQILSTFLDNAHCNVTETVDQRLFRQDGTPTRLTLTLFDLLCLFLYLFELYLKFNINGAKKSLSSKPWSLFRLFICVFVLLDCLLYFTDPTQPRLMRCVFPFLLISKRNNLKLMLQGLLVSGYQSLGILKALVTILVMWGFAGFFYFRGTDSATDAFANPGTFFVVSFAVSLFHDLQ
jgi:hypothetical protein